MTARTEIHTSYDSRFRRRISDELGDLLMELDREKSVGELLRHVVKESEREQKVMAELNQLWSERLVNLHARTE